MTKAATYSYDYRGVEFGKVPPGWEAVGILPVPKLPYGHRYTSYGKPFVAPRVLIRKERDGP